MTDTTRDAFEAYAADLNYNTDPDTRQGREGGYWSSHTDLMWRSWQAATEQGKRQPLTEGDAKDAERLDWLQSNPDKPPVYRKKRWACPGMTSYEYETFSDLRQALDAAITSQKGTV